MTNVWFDKVTHELKKKKVLFKLKIEWIIPQKTRRFNAHIETGMVTKP